MILDCWQLGSLVKIKLRHWTLLQRASYTSIAVKAVITSQSQIRQHNTVAQKNLHCSLPPVLWQGKALRSYRSAAGPGIAWGSLLKRTECDHQPHADLCTAGIGVETARALYTTGAKVFITARAGKGKDVVQDIEKTDKGGRLQLLDLDLASLKSVRAAAKAFLQESKQLNVLIANAGKRSACNSTN